MKSLKQLVLHAIRSLLREDRGGEWLVYENGVEYAGRVDKRGLVVMAPTRGSDRRVRRFRVTVEELSQVQR